MTHGSGTRWQLCWPSCHLKCPPFRRPAGQGPASSPFSHPTATTWNVCRCGDSWVRDPPATLLVNRPSPPRRPLFQWPTGQRPTSRHFGAAPITACVVAISMTRGSAARQQLCRHCLHSPHFVDPQVNVLQGTVSMTRWWLFHWVASTPTQRLPSHLAHCSWPVDHHLLDLPHSQSHWCPDHWTTGQYACHLPACHLPACHRLVDLPVCSPLICWSPSLQSPSHLPNCLWEENF